MFNQENVSILDETLRRRLQCRETPWSRLYFRGSPQKSLLAYLKNFILNLTRGRSHFSSLSCRETTGQNLVQEKFSDNDYGIMEDQGHASKEVDFRKGVQYRICPQLCYVNNTIVIDDFINDEDPTYRFQTGERKGDLRI